VDAAVHDVVAQGCSEEWVLLERDRYHPPIVVEFEIADVVAIERDMSGDRIEETQHQRDQGALAGAAGTRQGGDFANLRTKTHLVEDRRLRIVREADVIE